MRKEPCGKQHCVVVKVCFLAADDVPAAFLSYRLEPDIAAVSKACELLFLAGEDCPSFCIGLRCAERLIAAKRRIIFLHNTHIDICQISVNDLNRQGDVD